MHHAVTTTRSTRVHSKTSLFFVGLIFVILPCLLIAELLGDNLPKFNPQSVGNLLGQFWMRRSTKNLDIRHFSSFVLTQLIKQTRRESASDHKIDTFILFRFRDFDSLSRSSALFFLKSNTDSVGRPSRGAMWK